MGFVLLLPRQFWVISVCRVCLNDESEFNQLGILTQLDPTFCHWFGLPEPTPSRFPILLFQIDMHKQSFELMVADVRHLNFAPFITAEMDASAQARGTGIAKREPEYIRQKMLEGKAVIAFAKDGTWAGFCYIETWSHGRFVVNSGLIVSPHFRRSGLAKRIKREIFRLSRTLYPDAKIFGLTTGLAVMKINSELGYEPVTYSELTDDPNFWAGCKSCINYDILTSKQFKNCLCTAMLFDPAEAPGQPSAEVPKSRRFERFLERLKKIKPRIKVALGFSSNPISTVRPA